MPLKKWKCEMNATNDRNGKLPETWSIINVKGSLGLTGKVIVV